MMRPLLYSIGAVTEADSVAERAKAALAAGFSGIECTVRGDRLEREPRAALSACKAVATCCRETDADRALEEIAAQVSAASSAGAICLNLTIPPLGGDGFDRYQEALNFAHHMMHHIRHEAEPAGVSVALEAVSGGCLLSPVELREIIDAANSWVVGVCIDVNRIAKVGSPVDWIETLRHRVHAVRINLPLPEARCAHGSRDEGGTIDPTAIVRAMECVPGDRPLIIGGGTDARSARDQWHALVA